MTEDLIEVIPPDDICTWLNDPNETHADEKRRAFIINTYATSEIEGDVLVKNMQLIFEWLKTGKIPVKPDNKIRLKIA
jgi:hypothetical protein